MDTLNETGRDQSVAGQPEKLVVTETVADQVGSLMDGGAQKEEAKQVLSASEVETMFDRLQKECFREGKMRTAVETAVYNGHFEIALDAIRNIKEYSIQLQMIRAIVDMELSQENLETLLVYIGKPNKGDIKMELYAIISEKLALKTGQQDPLIKAREVFEKIYTDTKFMLKPNSMSKDFMGQISMYLVAKHALGYSVENDMNVLEQHMYTIQQKGARYKLIFGGVFRQFAMIKDRLGSDSSKDFQRALEIVSEVTMAECFEQEVLDSGRCDREDLADWADSISQTKREIIRAIIRTSYFDLAAECIETHVSYPPFKEDLYNLIESRKKNGFGTGNCVKH